MAALGVGMGLIASRLGNVAQSTVGPETRSEAGGLQCAAPQLGSALGFALIGAVVLSWLMSGFIDNVAADERVSDEVAQAAGVSVTGEVTFVAASEVESAAVDAGLADEEIAGLVEGYGAAQLFALRLGLLVAAAMAGLGLLSTGDLQSAKPG